MPNGIITTDDTEEYLEPDSSITDEPIDYDVDDSDETTASLRDILSDDEEITVIKLMGMNNIADSLEHTQLTKIGRKCKDDYETDEESLDEWRDQNEKSMKLAKQVIEKKTFPWTGASNVKVPLIGQAAMNFNARAYPEIIQGDKVVKAKVIGDDPDEAKAERADRISEHMSYQLLDEIPNWESDTDKLLIMLPIVGTMFREVSWDEINLRPSIKLLLPDELTVNYHAKSLHLEECRRISKKVTLFKNDIIERERAGLWLEIHYSQDAAETEDPIEVDQQEFIQQLCYLDLDEDGYEEPYMVTFLEESGQVVRIVANYDNATVQFDIETKEVIKIDPYQLFTDYHFIPAFDGSFYSTGFGSYLYPINQTVDTLINQLIDAGTLANLQGGFLGKGLRSKMGSTPFQPGEWRPVESRGGDIRNNIVPLPNKEPSPTLFNLMTFLLDMGKDMSSITDIMSGVPQGQNTPVGTTLAMIEQGMKVIDAVYKRIYRGLKSEYKSLYRINSIYLMDGIYKNILDDPEANAQSDYTIDDFDIIPIGDTKISSQVMRTMKAQATRQIAASTPGADVQEAARRELVSMGVDNPEEIIPKGPGAAEMQQMIEFLQGQVQTFQQHIKSGQMQIEADYSARENQESDAKVIKDMAAATKSIAEAEAKEIGQQLGIYQQQLQQMKLAFDQQKEVAKLEQQQINNRGIYPLGE